MNAHAASSPLPVAIVGTGPLPIEHDNYIYSSSNRTWQVAKALLDAGHRAHVIAFRPTRTQNGERINSPEHHRFEDGALTLDSVEEVAHFRNDDFMRDRIREAGSRLIIGVNSFPAGRVAELNLGLPFWADMNGYNMGEVQIRARLTGNDQAIPHGWREELQALCGADVFSAASSPQRYALIGELGAIGRLRAATCGYEFAYVVPNGREDPPPSPLPCVLRGEIGDEACLLLWVGCYNFQFDTDALFEGIDLAMSRDPRIHFASSGGKVDGHNETNFARFQQRVAASPHAARYHHLGWLPWYEFDSLLRAADAGITMDIPCYETEIGARNRLTEMMRVGLPAITTRGPEVAVDIAHGAGWIVEYGSKESLCEAILAASQSREECRRRGALARKLFLEKYTIAAATAPIVRWACNPWSAPDRGLASLLLKEPEPKTEAAQPIAPRGFWSRLFG